MSPLNAPSVPPLPICSVVPLSTACLWRSSRRSLSACRIYPKRAVGRSREVFIVAPDSVQSPLLVTLFRPLISAQRTPLRPDQIIVGAGAVVTAGNAAGYLLRTGIEGDSVVLAAAIDGERRWFRRLFCPDWSGCCRAANGYAIGVAGDCARISESVLLLLLS